MDKGAEKDILPERTHNSQAAWRDSPQHYSSGGANQNHAEVPMRMIAISNSMWQRGHQVRTTTGLLGRSDGKYSESSWESSTMSCHSYNHIRNWGRPTHLQRRWTQGFQQLCNCSVLILWNIIQPWTRMKCWHLLQHKEPLEHQKVKYEKQTLMMCNESLSFFNLEKW